MADLGIDLGTAQTVISAGGRIVLREPSVIAVDRDDGHTIACGREAYAMLGRTPDSILAVRPLQKGVISDYDYAEQMLRTFVRRVCAYKILKPRAAISIPASVTEVEQRSVVEAANGAGIRRVVLMEEAVAAAVGAGLDVAAAHGSMVVDLGAGTTDVAILSLKGVATTISLRTGGDDLDDAILRYMRLRYNLIIGPLTAEEVKKRIGCAIELDPVLTMAVPGRDAVSGLPRTQTVDSTEIGEAMAEPVIEIVTTIQKALETAPPELVGDVLADGITLTGGLANLRGIGERITRQTGVPCRVAEEPEDCVAKGTDKAIRYVGILSAGIYDIGQFTYPLADSISDE